MTFDQFFVLTVFAGQAHNSVIVENISAPQKYVKQQWIFWLSDLTVYKWTSKSVKCFGTNWGKNNLVFSFEEIWTWFITWIISCFFFVPLSLLMIVIYPVSYCNSIQLIQNLIWHNHVVRFRFDFHFWAGPYLLGPQTGK